MLILIDRISLRMIASASNHKLMNLVAKWDFPDADPLIVDSEIGREWTALSEDDMKSLYCNMSSLPEDQYPGYKEAIDQLRQYAGQWSEYPKPLSFFEDLEAQQSPVPHEVTTEEAQAAQSIPPEPEPEPEPQEEPEEEDEEEVEAPEPTGEVSRATHQAIITGVEAARAKLSPAEKAEAAASAPTKPQGAKEFPSTKLPPKSGATKRVWEIADAYFAKMGVADLKLMRKAVIAAAEAEGINSGTAGTQFGKWKATKGL